MKRKITDLENRVVSLRRKYFIMALTLAMMIIFTPFALAEGTDPLQAINNLSDFVFAAIKAIGVILLGWGVVQIGMSLQSHDPSQRSSGFLTFFGGLMIAFAKEILDLILKQREKFKGKIFRISYCKVMTNALQ